MKSDLFNLSMSRSVTFYVSNLVLQSQGHLPSFSVRYSAFIVT